MRRFALLCLAAVVATAGTASGALRPVPQSLADESFPRLRQGPPVSATLEEPGESHRVIMTLDDPPLAQIAPRARVLDGRAAPEAQRRELVRALVPLPARRRAERRDRELHAALPAAQVSRRYRVLLNGFAVSLPYAQLPKLLDLGLAEKVYPSLTYTSLLNRGPVRHRRIAVRGADGRARRGHQGRRRRRRRRPGAPVPRPDGLLVPGRASRRGAPTTPKVIVSRGFAEPRERTPPRSTATNSFHGTFVAGIIAGRANTDVPAGVRGVCGEAQGGCHPAVKGVSGVAPRAYVGNYRVFNVPLPLGGCCSGTTPEIVSAFEAAVADGMDIINFSGGGPQADPRTDALIPTVANVVRAGVVPDHLGRERPRLLRPRHGGVAGDVAGRDQRGLDDERPRLRQLVHRRRARRSRSVGFRSSPPTTSRPPGSTANQRLVDVGTISGTGGNRLLCEGSLPGGSLRGAIALVSRGGCQYEAKAARAREAGAVGMVVAENRGGDPTFALFSGLDGGTVSDLDGARLRQAMAGAGGAVSVRFNRDVLEVDTTWAGVPSSFSAGGLTPFGHALKPDVTAPGSQVLSSTLPEFAGDAFAVLDGTSFSAPHISGAAALLLQRHPTWTPKQMKSALMSTAGPSFSNSAAHGGGVGPRRGRRACARRQRRPAADLHGPAVALVRLPRRERGRSEPRDLGDGRGRGWRRGRLVGGDPAAGGDERRDRRGGAVHDRPGRDGGRADGRARQRRRAGRGQLRVHRAPARVGRASHPVRVLGHAAAAHRRAHRRRSSGSRAATRRQGDDRARVYRWPTSPFAILGIFGVDPSVNEDGRETVYSLDIPRQAVNAGVVVVRPDAQDQRARSGRS